MTRRALNVIACSCLMVLAAACGSDSPSAPTPTPTQGTLSLRNDANTPIVEVEIAPCADEVWGPNRLNAGETIAPGGTRTWSLAPGCYDVRAHTATKAGQFWDHTVEAGKTLNLALSSNANALRAALGMHKTR